MTTALWSDRFTPLAFEEAHWGKNGEIHLERRLIITDQVPPFTLVSSVRCVIVDRSAILVLKGKDHVPHVDPGGRVEHGERWEQTVVREVREETNLEITLGKQLGVLANIHLTPCPEGYPYPYPEFLQIIFVASAINPESLYIDDEWVSEGEFMSFGDTRSLDLEPIQRALVDLIEESNFRDCS